MSCKPSTAADRNAVNLGFAGSQTIVIPPSGRSTVTGNSGINPRSPTSSGMSLAETGSPHSFVLRIAIQAAEPSPSPISILRRQRRDAATRVLELPGPCIQPTRSERSGAQKRSGSMTQRTSTVRTAPIPTTVSARLLKPGSGLPMLAGPMGPDSRQELCLRSTKPKHDGFRLAASFRSVRIVKLASVIGSNATFRFSRTTLFRNRSGSSRSPSSSKRLRRTNASL